MPKKSRKCKKEARSSPKRRKLTSDEEAAGRQEVANVNNAESNTLRGKKAKRNNNQETRDEPVESQDVAEALSSENSEQMTETGASFEDDQVVEMTVSARENESYLVSEEDDSDNEIVLANNHREHNQCKECHNRHKMKLLPVLMKI